MRKPASEPAPTRLPGDYAEFLAEIKARIAAARTRAALAVNSELVKLYWEIGREILDRERRDGWGAKVIDSLAAALRRDFPEMPGFSRSNLHYMRRLAAAWPDHEIVPRAVGQLPWGHIRSLLDKLDGSASRLWYAEKALENGWSRKVLETQIARPAHDRTRALPRPQPYRHRVGPARSRRTRRRRAPLDQWGHTDQNPAPRAPRWPARAPRPRQQALRRPRGPPRSLGCRP
jgi:predicted nuclease of restriction endonuclease-like (RecB) superfamily